MDKKSVSSKAMLYRQNKNTLEITAFNDAKRAVAQFCIDFGKTEAIAKKNLFDLLVDREITYYQNIDIAWTFSLHLCEEE